MSSLPLSPSFSPIHSFIGGLMLASGVHSLLRQTGIVLGISGFFHTNVKDLISTSDPNAPPTTSNQLSSDDAQRIHHRISPQDDNQRQSDIANGFASQYFVHGLLAGGALLAASRVSLERALGAPIFDSVDVGGFHIGKGLSAGIFSIQAAKRFVPAAVWGALVGFGTKLGSGCTSGHFLCGLSRFSPRSIAATITFFSVAVLTNILTHPVGLPPSRKLAATLVPQSPSIWAVALLQLPALLYAVVIPAFVRQKQRRKDAASEEELKSTHEQAAKASCFFVGLHFSLGLALTGMTRPSKVLGFLNLSPSHIQAEQWDPSLAMVALGGITLCSISYFFSIKPRIEASKKDTSNVDAKPLYWRSCPEWRVLTRTTIDWRLILGAILFGIGWGATGLCPGPALTGFGASTLPAPQDQDALVALAYRGTFIGAVGLGGLIASQL